MPELLLLSRWLDPVPGFLARRAPRNALIGFVPTASSIYPDRPWVDLDRATLVDHGFRLLDMDLEAMSGTAVADALTRIDALFVSGGNTFHLLEVLRRTSSDRLITDAVETGLPYLGASAGAAIAGTDIEPLSLLDDPATALPLASTAALGFVDGVVVPHADGIVGGRTRIDRLRAEFGHLHRLMLLRDDQAIIVSDGVETVICS